MHFGRGFLNKPLKMNKEKSSNDFFCLRILITKFFIALCRADAFWQKLARSKLEHGNEKHLGCHNKSILSFKTYLLYVLFSYSYKSSITLEIPLSIPMTMHTATYRLFMYQDEPEGKSSCLALK